MASEGDTVRIVAALVTEDDVALLCDSVEDSLPEQCAVPHLTLIDAPLDDLGLTARAGERAGTIDIVVTVVGADTVRFVDITGG